MRDEYQIISENKQVQEVAEYCEAKQQPDENALPEEIAQYKETTISDGNKAAKKKSSASRLMSLLTTAAVALVAAVTIIAPSVLSDGTEVSFADLATTDEAVYCRISLENRSNNTLKAVLYNDFTNRETVIEGDELVLSEQGLKSNEYYTLAVKSGTKTLCETTFRTKREDEMPVTKFYSVSCACNCSNDGTFIFTMDFVDENGYYSDFKATLTDSSGNVSECVFTGDLHGVQSIEVTDSALAGDSATFTITCTSTENNPEGETVVLWQSTEEI